MIVIKQMMNNNGRTERLLRPLNTLDGRDVKELQESDHDKCDDDLCGDNGDNEMNDE